MDWQATHLRRRWFMESIQQDWLLVLHVTAVSMSHTPAPQGFASPEHNLLAMPVRCRAVAHPLLCPHEGCWYEWPHPPHQPRPKLVLGVLSDTGHAPSETRGGKMSKDPATKSGPVARRYTNPMANTPTMGLCISK